MTWNLNRIVGFWLIFLCGFTAAQISYECPRNWLENQEVCYNFVNSPQKTVQEASIYCQERGQSDLVSINSEAEHLFIQRTTKSYPETSKFVWFTSGLRRGTDLIWETDGSKISPDFFPDEETRTRVYKDPVSNIVYDRIVYTFNASTSLFQWGWGRIMKPGAFICEIKKEDTWKFYQQQRDFSFGTGILDPTKWPLGPKFRTQPKNTIFFELRTKDKTTNEYTIKYTPVTLECDASGNPEPTYKWYRLQDRNREPLPPSDKYAITNGVLFINNPDPNSDVGTYICESENKYGKILSDPVRLSYGNIGEFSNVQTSNYRGVEYLGLEMDCSPPAYKPAVTIKWFKEDIQHFIRPKYNPQMFVSKNGKLYISEVTGGDEGNYYCQVILAARPGEQLALITPPMAGSKPITLSIQGENANTYGPDIQDKFPQVFPRSPQVGQPMEIECIAYGRLPLSYRWERLDGEMNPDHYLTDHNRRLNIDSPRLEDSGVYCCIVTGVRDTLNKTVYVSMSQTPDFPHPLKDQHPDIGSQFRWTCNAVGVPVPTYSWYKDGVLLTNNNTFGLKVNRNQLHFQEINSETHDGMYQCEASNGQLSWRRSSAQLRAVGFAPTFERTPLVKSLGASVNGKVTIKCQPEAAPRPEISWTHNGGGLRENARILPNGALELSDLQTADSGEYTCTATNKLGDSSSSTTLQVIDRAVLIEKPEDIRVEENGTVTLDCKASYDEKNTEVVYSWTFNDHPIDFIREFAYSMPYVEQQDGSLLITGIQFKHDGYYTCEVITSTNVVKDSSYVTVLGPPSEPGGVHAKKSRNTTADLWWQMPGQTRGNLVAKYAIQKYSVSDKMWSTVVQDITDESTKMEDYDQWRSYVIDKLSPGTSFQFRVKAANAYGYGPYSRPSVAFRTDDAPPNEAPSDIGGGRGSELTLNITWSPLPRSKWGSSTVFYNVFFRRANTTDKWQAKKGLTMPYHHQTITEGLFYLPFEVKVQAENRLGPGPNSSIAIVYSAEKMPTVAPTNVQLNPVNNSACWVYWTPLPNTRQAMGGTVRAYQVNYWEDSDTTCPATLENTARFIRFYGNVSQGLVIGITPQEYVCVTVQFMNYAGLGPKTSSFSAGMNHNPPGKYPHFVTVKSHGKNSIRVIWQGVLTQVEEETIVGYKAWVWNIQEDMRAAREIDFGNTYTGVIRGIEKHMIYKLRLFAYGYGGDGRKSPDVYFTLGGQVLFDPLTMELMNAGSNLLTSILTLSLLFLSSIIFSTS